jgi:hypothetical protein
MTATVAGDKWRQWAEPVLAELGPMPGAPLNGLANGKKKQTTRLIKCQCGACGFTFRATQMHLGGHATLRCPDPECGGDVHYHLSEPAHSPA